MNGEVKEEADYYFRLAASSNPYVVDSRGVGHCGAHHVRTIIVTARTAFHVDLIRQTAPCKKHGKRPIANAMCKDAKNGHLIRLFF